ncbi:MAG: SMC-Scp complex subunit ScpB [Candidatus Paceibacterota bacterium]|jgi:segregation and condensation protein B
MLTPPAAIEAVLFSAGEPLSKKQLATLLGIKPPELAVALTALGDQLAGRGLSVIETEDEVELRTSADAAGIVKKLRETELTRDLGKGSLETLAVIAYQSSATRSEIDWVRGVNSSASLRTLLMRGLIDGKDDPADKRRVRYNLTTEALAHLGVQNLRDLPRAEELRAGTQAVMEEKAAADSALSE